MIIHTYVIDSAHGLFLQFKKINTERKSMRYFVLNSFMYSVVIEVCNHTAFARLKRSCKFFVVNWNEYI